MKQAAAILLLSVMLGAMPGAASADGPVVGPATCPVERAIYAMTTPGSDDTWRLALVPARRTASIASDLYLKLVTPRRAYWFTFSVSQGYSGMSVFPVTDPYAEDGAHDLLGPPFGASPDGADDPFILSTLRFLSFDEELKVFVEPPMRGEEAPPFIMLPETGLALWYHAAALTGDGDAARDPMPRGMFKRTECRVPPPPEAGP